MEYPSSANDTAAIALHPGREIRKLRRLNKRLANQAERTRIREHLQAGLRDPEFFLDLEGRAKNFRRLLASGPAERRGLLQVQKRKVKAELGNTRDLDTFIRKTSRSRTLYALIAMGFFRHVLRSEEYREGHRYKLAIQGALQEPGLAKAIARKWENFDREFPDRRHLQTW
jgi:hypothetical protein